MIGCEPSSSAQVEMLGYMQEPAPGHRWLLVRQSKIWRPPTDVFETDSQVVVKVEVAGMEGRDFSVALNARTLTISGARRDPAEKLAYQQMEILYGEFETQVYLPWTVDEDGIEASYQDGFLSVRLPKSTPRHIPVVRLPEAPA